IASPVYDFPLGFVQVTLTASLFSNASSKVSSEASSASNTPSVSIDHEPCPAIEYPQPATCLCVASIVFTSRFKVAPRCPPLTASPSEIKTSTPFFSPAIINLSCNFYIVCYWCLKCHANGALTLCCRL